MNFTLLTLYLFNSFASGVMISTGLHDNMKMSQKLHQNGNSETGSQAFAWEPTALTAVSLTHLPIHDQGLWEPSKTPGSLVSSSNAFCYFQVCKQIWIYHLTKSHVNSAYTFTDLVCPAASQEQAYLFAHHGSLQSRLSEEGMSSEECENI